jgi:hypothetical protein
VRGAVDRPLLNPGQVHEVTRKNSVDRESLSGWLLASPAFSLPQLLTSAEWPVSTFARIREWGMAGADSQQEAELVALWNAACAWCGRVDIDEVEIIGAEGVGRAELATMGFERRVMFLPRNWPFPWTIHWFWAGEPAEAVKLLRRLRERGTYSLVARSLGVDRLSVGDSSWDAVYLNVAGLDQQDGYDRVASMVRESRSARHPPKNPQPGRGP